MKAPDTLTDPIVDELHCIRQEIVKEAGGDLEALGAWLMESQERHGDRLIASSKVVVSERAVHGK